MAFCSNCGAKTSPEMKFCNNCGTAISAAHEKGTGRAAPAQPQETDTPPAQQAQSGYTPPAQQAQSGYTPPAQQAQGGYTPPAQQAQSGYTPPAQQAQSGYTPPAQQAQGGGYTPPAQPQYGAQSAYAIPQTAVGQKKPFNKKLLLFGGIAIAAVAVIGIILALTLGGKSDPYAGIWNGVKMEAQGISIDIQEALGGGFVFDIKSDGSCALTFGPDKLSGTWEKAKGGILIKADEFTFPCELKGTTLVIENYADSGMTLTLEKEGGKAGADSAASSDPNAGVWNVVSAEMWGEETDIRDVFANGFTIELMDKGKCRLNIDGTEGEGKWTLKGSVLTIKGSRLDASGTLEDGLLVLEDVMGLGLNLSFRKEGAQAGINGANIGFPTILDEEEIVTGFQSPTTTIEEDSYWYGTAVLSNFIPVDRAAEVEGAHDVWGYIGSDNSGRAYFEVFDEPEMTSEPLLSLYIDLYDTFFDADIGEEDAWLIGTYLDQSDEYYFSPSLDNGALRIDYHGQGKNTSYDILIFLREDGAPWDEENDILPPGYDDYKAGLDGSAAQGGDGETPSKPTELLSAAELKAAYDAMDPSGMTYEEVRDLYLHGVDGEREERDNPDIRAYVWYAQEGSEKRLYVSFKKNAADKYIYTSRSLNNIS